MVNLVTALVPSETACLASSPGKYKRTAVWTSREPRVCFLLYLASLLDSAASFWKTSCTKLFMIDIDRLEIPVSGCTYLSTLKINTLKSFYFCLRPTRTLFPSLILKLVFLAEVFMTWLCSVLTGVFIVWFCVVHSKCSVTFKDFTKCLNDWK